MSANVDAASPSIPADRLQQAIDIVTRMRA